MSRIKVGVCECSPELLPGTPEWNDLCRSVSRESPDLFLLNEMPFGPWLSAGATFEEGAWQDSCAVHARGVEVLGELGAATVALSRPRDAQGRRLNEALLWTATSGAQSIHTKQYFPDEEGYFEARWFAAGEGHFRLAAATRARVGFLICTEVMFNEHARRYGRNGGQVILVPRAVGAESLRRWRVALRMAAIVSGCYVLSSNRTGRDSRGQAFGGAGWIIDPWGDVVSQTSQAAPVVFHEVDLEAVARAQAEYPCSVREPEAAVGTPE